MLPWRRLSACRLDTRVESCSRLGRKRRDESRRGSLRGCATGVKAPKRRISVTAVGPAGAALGGGLTMPFLHKRERLCFEYTEFFIWRCHPTARCSLIRGFASLACLNQSHLATPVLARQCSKM